MKKIIFIVMIVSVLSMVGCITARHPKLDLDSVENRKFILTQINFQSDKPTLWGEDALDYLFSNIPIEYLNEEIEKKYDISVDSDEFETLLQNNEKANLFYDFGRSRIYEITVENDYDQYIAINLVDFTTMKKPLIVFNLYKNYEDGEHHLKYEFESEDIIKQH